MKKKILYLLLACFIVFISLPLSALAEAGQTEPETGKGAANLETEVTEISEDSKQPVGNYVKYPPELFAVNTRGISRVLALYGNGELWMVSDEKVEKITDNVKKCEPMKNVIYGVARACFLLEDRDSVLWTLEIGEDGVSQLSKRVENVVKYQGCHVSQEYKNYALDAGQFFWTLDDENQSLYSDVKDFILLTTSGKNWEGGVAVLKNNGDLLVCTDGVFETLETGVDSLVQENLQDYRCFSGFIKNDILYSCDLNADIGRIEAVKKGEGIKVYYEIINEKLDLFVCSDGATWARSEGTDSAHKVLNNALKAYESRFATFDSGCFYLLDDENVLYRWTMDADSPAQKVADKVKTYFGGICLTENGDLYQLSESSKEIVYSDVEQVLSCSPMNGAYRPADTSNIYLVKKDHTLYKNKTELLTGVSNIIWDINPDLPQLRGIYIVRLDGTIWYSKGEKEGDPNPYKLSDYQAEIPVTGIKLSQSALTLTQGYTAQLQAAIEPEDATNQNISWSSSHPDIATVENGLVTGVKKGEAVITVITEDGGKTAECKVTVKKAVPVLDPDSGIVQGITAGETGQILAEKLKDSGAIEDENQIKLYKADGQEASLDTRLATGMKLVVTIGQRMFNRNAGTQEYTVIVLGDASADGIINILDMLAAQDDILGKEKLEGCYRTAADITKDNAVNILDMLAIQDDILGKEKINPYV